MAKEARVPSGDDVFLRQFRIAQGDQFRMEQRIDHVLSDPEGWLRCARAIVSYTQKGAKGGAGEWWEALANAQRRDSRRLAENVCKSLEGKNAGEAKALLRSMAACGEFGQLGSVLLNAEQKVKGKHAEFFAELGREFMRSQGLDSKIEEAAAALAREGKPQEVPGPDQMVERARVINALWKALDADLLSQQWASLSAAYRANPGLFKDNFAAALGSRDVYRIRMQRFVEIPGWEKLDKAVEGKSFMGELPESARALLRKRE